MRERPPHKTDTVLSWGGWSWLNRTKGNDCRLALSVTYSLSRRTRMFSQRPGPISEPRVLHLTMDSKSTGNPTRAGAATILFSIFVTRRESPTRSDLCKTNLLQQATEPTPRCARILAKSEQQTDLPRGQGSILSPQIDIVRPSEVG